MSFRRINHRKRYLLCKIRRRLAEALKCKFAKGVSVLTVRCHTFWTGAAQQILILSSTMARVIALTALWHKIEQVSGKLRRWVDWYWSAIIRTAKTGYGQVHGTEMLIELLELLESYGDRLPLEVTVCSRSITGTLIGQTSVNEWRKMQTNSLGLQQVGDHNDQELRSYRWTSPTSLSKKSGHSRPQKRRRQVSGRPNVSSG